MANKGYVIGVGMTKFEKPGPEQGQQQDRPPHEVLNDVVKPPR